MTKAKPDKKEKQSELEKYRDLVTVTLDYYINGKGLYGNSDYFTKLKVDVEEH